MSANTYLEDISSQIPAIHLLTQMGYEFLSRSEVERLRYGKKNNVVLESILRNQLKKINSISFKEKKYEFSDASIDKAVSDLIGIHFDSLGHTSEKVYDLLVGGKSLEQIIDGYKRSYPLHYIDFKNIENNVFHLAEEFSVEIRDSKETLRPDLVLFVNGIPLSIIECKRPDLPGALDEAISQHLRNQQARNIPHLYIYSQILIACTQNKASYATTGTPKDFWATWNEEHQEQNNAKIAELINAPMFGVVREKIFENRELKDKEILAQGTRQVSPQDQLLYNLLRPERLLRLMYQFILFDNKIKKICRYQQFFAIEATLQRVKELKHNGAREGGVIWHTTGSGKSLTMVLIAKALSLEKSIANARVLIVTDRVDLDKQIGSTFEACGKKIVNAKTGKHLIELLISKNESVITTIIDKFETASNEKNIVDHDPNIFILIDEAHRSQYGEAHAKMRNIFPNACFLGFTGTPLLKKEKNTVSKMGGFIHKYTMNQAVRDGAVTPLLYEGRICDLQVNKEKIDSWFDKISKNLGEKEKIDLKKKINKQQALLSSMDRLDQIAYDISIHYSDVFQGRGFKGQLACSSKKDAIRYKRALDKFGMITSEVVISSPDSREGNEDIDESKINEVQSFWNAKLAEYGGEKNYTSTMIKRFKESEEPEILIVVDKLLTGFDAPNNTVLYIDKNLKEHGLLQAIARVNRVFEGKHHGLIIDYRGIFGALNEAIDIYGKLEKDDFDKEDIEGSLKDISEEIANLRQYHTNLWQVFKEVANKDDIESMQRHLEPLDKRDDFYKRLKIFFNVFDLAKSSHHFIKNTPKETIAIYKKDLKFFLSLRIAIKERFGETIDYSRFEKLIETFVDRNIGAGEVRQLREPISIFAEEEFQMELDQLMSDVAKADTILARIKNVISEKMEEDPAHYQSLGKMIEEALENHRQKRISDAQYLAQMEEARKQAQGKNKILHPKLEKNLEAQVYFGILEKELGGSEAVIDLACQIEDILSQHKIRDWFMMEEVQKKMLNDIEDVLFAYKKNNSLDFKNKIIDDLMESIITSAKAREMRK